MAAQKGCTPAQLVLAWIVAQGPDFFTILGTKTIQYLEQNVGAVDIENISRGEQAHQGHSYLNGGCWW